MKQAWQKCNFLYYTDWAEQLLTFPAELRLKIDDAVKRYVLYGEEPTDREVIYSMFGLMRAQIDRNRVKYHETCKKNAANAHKRWECERIQSDASAYDRIRANAVDANNDNDNDDDNDDDDKDIDKKHTNVCKESADKPHKAASKRTAFVAPSLEELRVFISEQGLKNVNPEEFIDHYTANGWRAGRNPMKDWKATARNWNRRSPEFNTPKNSIQNESKQRYKDL